MSRQAIDPARLQQTLEQLGQGLAVVGPDLTLRLWNRSYADLLGLPEGMCRPQARYADILEHRSAAVLASEGPKEYVRAQLAALTARTDLPATIKHASGRVVEIERLWLGDGSFLELARETAPPSLEFGRPKETAAEHDEITGLPNRNYFLGKLEKSLANGATPPATLLFVGLEDFQDVNDFLGHALGNALLRGVADRLTSIAGADATVARLTGVEFALLMPNITTTDDASVFAERLIHNLQRDAIPVGSTFEIDVNASIGITRVPEDGDEPGQLMRNADLALSRARASRSRRYHFFQPEMDEAAKRLGLIKLELRHALEREELVVFYQPKINIRDGNIIGMEALLRWRHPEHGMIPPGQFIPVAERTGLIAPISDWMMRQACRQTRVWNESGLADLVLAVNLSTVQFRRQSVIGTITGILEDTGFDPEKLEVEVTESVLLGDDEIVTETFSWLKAIGIPIAIDDFGTGYSSLSYLMRFAADTVKIDASFIKNLHDNQDGATITRAIISLAHSLKMKVVAEGIELPQHLMFLSSEGCDIGQGYLFSRPVPANEFEALLKQKPNFVKAVEASLPLGDDRRTGIFDRRQS
jgi:diguanylate cyclase (GGDEF)-like protein